MVSRSHRAERFHQYFLGIALAAILLAPGTAAFSQPLTARYERKWGIPDLEGEDFTRWEVRNGAVRQAMGDVYIKMIRTPGMGPVEEPLRRDHEARWALILALVKVREKEDVLTEGGKRYVRVVADASVELENLSERAKRAAADQTWLYQVNQIAARSTLHWEKRVALRERGEKEGAAAAAELKKEYAALLPLMQSIDFAQRGLVLLRGRSEPNDAGQAKGYFRQALRLDPHFTFLLSLRAEASIATSDWNEAVSDLDEYLRTTPTDVRALNNRGWAHLQAKRYDAAKADFQRAVGLVPAFGTAWVNLGYAEHYLNRRSSAYAAWRKGCETGLRETCDWLKKNPE